MSNLMTSEAVRSKLLEALKLDLVGPPDFKRPRLIVEGKYRNQVNRKPGRQPPKTQETIEIEEL